MGMAYSFLIMRGRAVENACNHKTNNVDSTLFLRLNLTLQSDVESTPKSDLIQLTYTTLMQPKYNVVIRRCYNVRMPTGE